MSSALPPSNNPDPRDREISMFFKKQVGEFYSRLQILRGEVGKKNMIREKRASGRKNGGQA